MIFSFLWNLRGGRVRGNDLPLRKDEGRNVIKRREAPWQEGQVRDRVVREVEGNAVCALAGEGIAETHSCSRTPAIARTPLQRPRSRAECPVFSSFVVVVKDLFQVYFFLLFIY